MSFFTLLTVSVASICTVKIVFQMLVRFGSCRELADDEEAVTRLCRLFGDLEKCNTPSALLFPWFPSPARKAREKITAELFVFLSNYVDVRRKASVVSSDAIDTLLTSGWDTEKIVSVMMPTLVIIGRVLLTYSLRLFLASSLRA